MNLIKNYTWMAFTMFPWVFKHSYHATNHQVEGSAIEKNFDAGYFRCRRCQERLTVPSSIKRHK